jgi:serine/threonine protein kinase/WD40 repeat protein
MQQNCPEIDDLSHWLADALPASKMGVIEAHIETCAHCQAAVEKLLEQRAEKRRPGGESTVHQAEAEFLQRVAMQEPSAFEAVTAVAPLWDPLAAAPLPVIKGYEILEEIGRGGMGIVYKACQRDLNRLVAIKMLLLRTGTTPQTRIRFLQEAELAARLQHPNIVQVHEISHQEQRAFLVMEFVEGGSLSHKCDGRPQPAVEATRLVEVLARAIGHAHRKGVLHRDLKPGNVLLTAEGVPKIADFGLATCIGLESGLTSPGDLLGTPGYMAPEQVKQRERQIGPATDVYGLGAILYELLTGRPPITGTDLMDVLVRLREEEVIPPCRLQLSVPRDLETVCLKCLQKDPRHRYASAEALADDLCRFLDGKPTIARPVSLPERAWRWAKRNPTLAATLGAVALLLVVLAIGSTISAVLFRGERDRAVDAEGRAETARRATQDLLARRLQSVAGEVRAMRLRGERGAYYRGMPKLRETLAQARELGAPEEVIRAIRDEIGNLLTIGDIEITRELHDLPAGAGWIVFSPNLDRYATIRIGGVMTVHETGTGKEISKLPVPVPLTPWPASFTPDGRLYLFSGVDKKVYCWNVDTPKAILRWNHDGYSVVPSPDGKVALYSHGNPNTTVIVEVQTGKEIRRLSQGVLPHPHPIHPDRPWAMLTDAKKLIAVDYRTGKEIGSVPDYGDVCWHPSAPVVAVGSYVENHRINLWDVTTGRRVVPPLIGHSSPGVIPLFDRSGRYLLTADWSEIVRVWDASTGRLVFQTPLKRNGHIQFGPDGETAAATSQGQRLAFFRTYPGEGLRIVPPANRESVGFWPRLAIEPGGRVIAASQHGSRTSLLDAENGRELCALPGKRTLVGSNRVDGSLLVVGEGGVDRWPVRHERGIYRVGPPEHLALPRYDHELCGVSADGRVIAIPNYNRGGFVLNRMLRGGFQPTEPQHDVRNMDVSPDGRWVVASSHIAGEVSVYDARTGKREQRLILDGGNARFSPGGRWVGVYAAHGASTLFRASTWELVRPLGDSEVAFSSDDKLAAVGEGYGVIRLIGTEIGQEITRLETSDKTQLHPLEFSPDGGRLYALGEQTRSLYIWDLRRIRARLKAIDADWDWPELSPLPKPADDAPPTVRIEIK